MADLNVTINMVGAQKASSSFQKVSRSASTLGKTVSKTFGANFNRAVSGAAKGLRSFGSALVSVKGLLLGVGLAIAARAFAGFAKSAAAAASTAEETQNLFDVSFGGMAMAAEDWASRIQIATGVNDTTLKAFSGTLFNMTSAMGITREAAFDMATGFTELALDTASFFNIPFDQAFNKIRAGLVGESEPLKQLGVLVTDNTIKQTEFAMAIIATGRQLNEQEKVTARAIVIQRGLENASGDLVRTQNSWANQTRLVGEAWTDFLEVIGRAITENVAIGIVVSDLTSTIREMTTFVEENREALVTFINKALLATISALELLANVMGKTILVMTTLQLAWLRLIEIATFFVRKIPGVGQGIEDWITTMRNATETIRDVGTGLDNLGDRLGDLGTNIEASREKQLAAAKEQDIITAFYKNNADVVAQASASITQSLDMNANVTDAAAARTEAYGAVLKALGGDQDLAGRVFGELTLKATEQRDAMKELADAAGKPPPVIDKITESAQKLAASLGQRGVIAEMDALNLALEELNKSGDRLSQEGLDKVLKKMTELKMEGVELRGQLLEISTAFREFGTEKLSELAAGLGDVKIATELTKEQSDELGESLRNIFDEPSQATIEYQRSITNLDGSLIGVTTTTRDWGEALESIPNLMGDVGNVLAIFGINIDSVIGKITRFISAADSLINSLGGIVNMITGGGGALGGGGGLAGLLGSLFGGGGGAASDFVGPLQDAGSQAGTGILSGLSTKLSAGLGKLGSTLAPFFTNPFTIAIAAGIVGFFALKGLFGGRNAETVMEEAGRDLGATFSKGLAEQINEGGKNVQLSLANIFAETGAAGFGAEGSSFGLEGIARFAEEAGDILSGVEQGLFSIDEAAAALTPTVAILIENFDSLGEGGRAQVERIVAAASRLGVEFDGLQELTMLVGNTMRLSADEAVQGFIDMGGAAEKWSNHLQKKTTDAARAMERLQRIIGRVQAGLDLNTTQTRFLGNVGIPPSVSAASGTDFIATSPTTLNVGEGNMPERVTVQPLNRMRSRDMGVGGGSSISISAPISISFPNAFVAGDPRQFAEKLAGPITDVLKNNIGGQVQDAVIRLSREGK